MRAELAQRQHEDGFSRGLARPPEAQRGHRDGITLG
jgi:hypothetical protein